ncbi:hypothetical protein [Geobacter argillaceus]|uniref:Uncharacterized protein n=1 Tax=Geobacter argillaceus TaxID=345631 RepID=A0A562V716_9BACT|nr:hypothetical protein [Geobacter argillaceus]TWJ13517.1 hypothetical protein JN12_03828 [Geobacter argillaceus]
MSYREMSKTLLQQENPRELKRLKEAGILEQTVVEVGELFDDQEQTIVEQMTADLPAGMSDLERTQEENMARIVAREVTAHDLAEFWRSGGDE